MEDEGGGGPGREEAAVIGLISTSSSVFIWLTGSGLGMTGLGVGGCFGIGDGLGSTLGFISGFTSGLMSGSESLKQTTQ